MLYRKMPKTGDELSILGFGAMRLPMKDGQIDEERALAQVRGAIDRGINYVDTAWPYHFGASEPFVGRALQDGYRDKVYLATKLPCWMVNSREEMDKYLNAQLERLQTDRIDYYLMHSLGWDTWKKMLDLGILEFIDTIKKDGRVKRVGFSFHSAPEEFNPIVDTYDWDFAQIQFNYLDRDYQAGLAGLKYLAEKNIGVIIMEPLRGGSLANPVQPDLVQAVWDEADVKRTPVEWALRWVWNYPEVGVILSGMNEEAHIDQNIAVACEAHPLSLTAKELELVDRAEAAFKKLLKVNCTGCEYCLPCPVGVKIPSCFEYYNNRFLFDDLNTAMFRYAMVTGEAFSDKPNNGFASQCVSCGECVDKCPQGIAIPDVLQDVVNVLEAGDFQGRVAGARAFARRTI
ncbi:aldo/keto reductase [Seleniivibrio woodruffii]|uniref:4Fe-4S ferredoxin-type domain-containing protein n=1 Tax=Seleniivibrio woodruffii TaxID=1078050 RepID=A0A4R1K585_9BACT|nr:aldo/keto reductase [Seleniivibrio woodruffii]TCK59335.1 hypothetical protein C8D98_2268 [Seleniivibrio woodruffii]TVZ35626.1 hypothetical protein OF66_1241 [Seleniivibrio woodruffii]